MAKRKRATKLSRDFSKALTHLSGIPADRLAEALGIQASASKAKKGKRQIGVWVAGCYYVKKVDSRKGKPRRPEDWTLVKCIA